MKGYGWVLKVKFAEGQPRVPAGNPEGGQWTETSWAEGVVAARRLGGQVPQAAVNRAERILSQAGLKPTTRKAPAKFDDIKEFYESHKPVVGDVWTAPKGMTVTVSKLGGRPDGGVEVDLFVQTPRKGYVKTLYVDKDWGFPRTEWL